MACNAYEHTHMPDARVTCPSEACQAMEHERVGGNPPSFLFQTAVQSLWWMTFASTFASGIICMSAPCPAWSLADAAPGLLRSDGLLILIAIFCTAILRPRLMISETVSNLKLHFHWRLVALVIEWLNHKIRWNQALDLREIIPQACDRVIMKKGTLPNVHTALSLVINLQTCWCTDDFGSLAMSRCSSAKLCLASSAQDAKGYIVPFAAWTADASDVAKLAVSATCGVLNIYDFGSLACSRTIEIVFFVNNYHRISNSCCRSCLLHLNLYVLLSMIALLLQDVQTQTTLVSPRSKPRENSSSTW